MQQPLCFLSMGIITALPLQVVVWVDPLDGTAEYTQGKLQVFVL